MANWTRQANELIVKHKFNKKDLEFMCREVPVCFRDGAKEFAENCNAHEIPLLVFSAVSLLIVISQGLGDIIEEIMRQHEMTVGCMHIVSNMMEFNEDGLITSFKEPLIHILNKNEANIKGEDRMAHNYQGRPITAISRNETM